MPPQTRTPTEPMLPDSQTSSCAAWLANARSVCVLTGAGMSAESGVPTFRDPDGHWSRFNPAELATPQAFQRDPLKVWAWYRQRREALQRVLPHAGHRVLAAWEHRIGDFHVITQNVDGLHHRAGSQNVIELHGRLDVVRCVGCRKGRQTLEDLGPDPHCDSCSSRLRPGVVWFGEPLPNDAFEHAVEAARRCDLMLVIGTSGQVQPAASLAELARGYGAKLIDINPNRSELSDIADLWIAGKCGDVLTAIDATLA